MDVSDAVIELVALYTAVPLVDHYSTYGDVVLFKFVYLF